MYSERLSSQTEMSIKIRPKSNRGFWNRKLKLTTETIKKEDSEINKIKPFRFFIGDRYLNQRY